MPEKFDALAVLLILLPGFSCAYLVQLLVVRRKQSDFERVVEAVLFSFLLYLLCLPFFHWSLPFSWAQSQDHVFHIQVNKGFILSLGMSAVVLGLFYSAALNHDWLLALFRKCGITERTARSTIWNDAFQDIPNHYVSIGLSDKRQVIGYVRYYSDEADDCSIFLEDAAWIDPETSDQIPIDGPGILLTRQVGIEFVMFLSPHRDPDGQDS